ncbi:MAG: TetR/AcrR family transcriptional regulator [Pseudomonadota bacterium]
MKKQSTGTYHHGDLRRALLDAADVVLEEQGMQGFTLRACARQAGVSHAAPAHHFKDIQGVLRAVAERGFARLVNAIKAELALVEGDLEAEMSATARAYVGFAEAHPEHFRIMFRADLMEFDADNRPDSVKETFLQLTNVILRQRNDPQAQPGEVFVQRTPEQVNDILLGWCYVHGYAHLKAEGQLTLVPEDAHEAQMELAARRLSGLIRSLDSARTCV